MNGVYALIIQTKFGTDVTVYSTLDKARDSLYEFVEEWWDEDTDIPEDKSKAIDYYFTYHDCDEWYDIEYCSIDPE